VQAADRSACDGTWSAALRSSHSLGAPLQRLAAPVAAQERPSQPPQAAPAPGV